MCNLKEDRGLSLRSLFKFNLALLAKQGWRLLSNPNSLLASILKAKYYHHSNFLSSVLKPNASYTWRRIWAAKKVLMDGLC